MNRQIKKRWLKALRSGQYKQAQKRLTDGAGFCCLGVLCNLHALETGTAWERSPAGSIYYLGDSKTLPTAVRDWAGLATHNPTAGANGLAVLNDGDPDLEVKPHDFQIIADRISRYL